MDVENGFEVNRDIALWNGAELNRIFGTSLLEDLKITGVSIDSRTLADGDLYVALQGVSQDGHLFVEAAIAKGARAILVTKPMPFVNVVQIIVDDTLKALAAMASFARSRSNAKIIAITGSVGKTTTKEILAYVLQDCGIVSYSTASLNNHWGVPLSLARLHSQANFGIFEVGMNHIGEIAPLVAMIKPHISVITNIAPAHLGNMKNMQTIAREKSAIYAGLLKNGSAIVPTDTEFYNFLLTVASFDPSIKILKFGAAEQADIKLTDYCPTAKGSLIDIEIFPRLAIQYNFSLRGRHNAVNSLIAFAVARCLNIDEFHVGLRLQTIPSIKNRGEIYELELEDKKIILIDDAYNANLTSMKAGIDLLLEYSNTFVGQLSGRRIAVLGEMLELGEYAAQHHADLGKYLESKNINIAYLSGGEAMQHCLEELSNSKQGGFVSRPMDLMPLLQEDLQNGDIILVKGSKGSYISLVVEELLKKAAFQNRI